MYLTNKTDCYLGKQLYINREMCFLYTVWFCLRRLAFVMLFFFTHFFTSQYQCLTGILLIQTTYLAYIL